MKIKRSFLQKMIVSILITIIMCNILVIPVHGFVYNGSELESSNNSKWIDEGQNLKEIYIESSMQHRLFYIFNFNGEKHAVRVESQVNGENMQGTDYLYPKPENYKYLINDNEFGTSEKPPYTQEELEAGAKEFQNWTSGLGTDGRAHFSSGEDDKEDNKSVGSENDLVQSFEETRIRWK